MSQLDVERLRAQIPALQQCIYLNTGTSGPLPARVVSRMRELLAEESVAGPAAPDRMRASAAEAAAARQAVASLCGADADELALAQNASQGLTLVAAGYPWQPGDEVLTTEQEHVSGLVPWYGLARYRGARVRVLPVHPDPDDTVSVFAAAIRPETRLIAVSHVSYCTGMRLPVEALSRLARERGVLMAVDGAQAIGQIPVDLHALGCDFYAMPGQKWLLGPDGTGAFYVRSESLERLHPPALGWASVTGHDLAGSFSLFPNARRFETATVSTPLVGGLRAAAEFALDLGIEAIARRIASLASHLKRRLAELPGVTLLTPLEPERSAGLVAFTVDGVDAEQAAQRLWREHRILCRSIPRPYCLCFSVHAFNTEAELDAAVEAVAGLRTP